MNEHVLKVLLSSDIIAKYNNEWTTEQRNAVNLFTYYLTGSTIEEIAEDMGFWIHPCTREIKKY